MSRQEHHFVASEEHDPKNSLFHGSCAIDAEVWPCTFIKAFNDKILAAIPSPDLEDAAAMVVAADDRCGDPRCGHRRAAHILGLSRTSMICTMQGDGSFGTLTHHDYVDACEDFVEP